MKVIRTILLRTIKKIRIERVALMKLPQALKLNQSMIFSCEVNGYKRVTRRAKHRANKSFCGLAEGIQQGIQYHGEVTLVPGAERSATRRGTRSATRCGTRSGIGSARRGPS